jgi:photosystem II stability/assembly factor-like uncharacterized protein
MTGHLASRICIASLVALAHGRALPADPGWRLVAKRTFEHRVTAAGFLDERHGLTVGGAGAGTMSYVFHTADGGRTWREAADPSGRRHALELLPGGFAWHAGLLQIGRSFDYGQTWYRGGNFGEGEPSPAIFLSFADENRGLVATARRLARTGDGGLRWTAVTLPAGATELAAISLAIAPPRPRDRTPALVALHTVRPVVGRVLDGAGEIWTTSNDGASWTAAESPLAGKRLRLAGGAATSALRFTSAGEGVVAAFVEEGRACRLRIWRSRAGEAGWVEEAFPAVTEPGALFLSPDARVLTWKSLERGELRVYARDAPARTG